MRAESEGRYIMKGRLFYLTALVLMLALMLPVVARAETADATGQLEEGDGWEDSWEDSAEDSWEDDWEDSDIDTEYDYIIADSDARLLTKSELRQYSLDELGYIRNEILARYGYPFKTEKYRDYFESKWWYERDEDFDYNWLSATESKNVELVKKIEQEKTT